MSALSRITAILTTPGYNSKAEPINGAGYPGNESILLGLVLDDKQVAWGHCAPAKGQSPSLYPDPFRAEDAIQIIQDRLKSLLVGQRLTVFRDLSITLNSLYERVELVRPLPPTPQAPGLSALSRRELISSLVQPREKPTPVERVTVERLIHPAIRYGASQALLAAVALSRGQSMIKVLCEEFGLPLPSSAVPFHITIRRGQTFQLRPQIASLGYCPTGADPKSILGPNGEKLQHFVRLLRENMQGLIDGEQQAPAIHLALNGNFGRLYDDAPGKILGALYGLQQVAAPHPIRVEDPLLKTERQEQVEALSRLKQYLRLRRMSLRLATGALIDRPNDVNAFLKVDGGEPAVDMIHLQMARLGGIHDTMQAIANCQDHGVAVLLEGGPVEVSAAVALAARPDLLAVGSDVDAAQNEMSKTLAWLRYKW